MRRDEVVLRLRQLETLRLQVVALEIQLEKLRLEAAPIEAALNALAGQERDILTALYIRPKMGNADKLCEKWEIERSTVYRRRDKALKKLGAILETCGTEAG